MPERTWTPLPKSFSACFSILIGLCLASPAESQELLQQFDGATAGDLFGRSTVAINDVDGDGVTDFAVGARADLGMGLPGHVYVFSGATGTELHNWLSENPTDRFGVSISSTPDMDGDIFGDVIVGAWKYAQAGGPTIGKVYIYSGNGGNLIRSHVGTEDLGHFGHAVAGIGDVNLDTVPDVLIGASGALQGTGAAYIYSGADGSLIRSFAGEFDGDDYGLSVAGLGDVNNDGIDDFVVGARYHDARGMTQSGRVYVYSGSDFSVLHIFDGESALAEMGSSLSSAGDIDLDGHDDILAGAVLAGPNGEGMVYLFSGDTGAVLRSWTGEVALDYFGTSVSKAGDVDADGTPDVLIGASAFHKSGTDPGWSYLYSGETGALIWRFDGEVDGDRFGISCAGVGDSNGDGCEDVLVGAYLNDAQGESAGRAYLYSGNDLFLSTGEDVYSKGDFFSLTSSCGAPFAPVGVFVWTVNGQQWVPYFLLSGVTDITGEWTAGFTIPFDIGGYSVGFKAFSPKPLTGVAQSNIPEAFFN